ncbi:hypothetical protein FQN57_003700 [Myotisia sp. PD_48]|nr:hypothetical protein FQN57_003700 [Myotisia sp. PD_48]
MTATATATFTRPVASIDASSGEQDSNFIPRGPIEASLNFHLDPADGSSTSFHYVETPPQGEPQFNYSQYSQKVDITDIRNRESDFSLDQDAFQALQNISSTADPSFTDEDNIQSVYYPEVQQLILKHVPGAKRVVIFDHTIRRAHPDAHRKPVTRVHIDQTPKSAAQRVRTHLPADEAEELIQGRYRIINVWRPINGPVQMNPLAVASSVSVPDEDLVPVELRYPHRTGETFGVKYSPGQRWYYWSGMTNEERLLLKCSDSLEDTPGRRVPHTAFSDPRTPIGAKARESIEVRALVFG